MKHTSAWASLTSLSQAHVKEARFGKDENILDKNAKFHQTHQQIETWIDDPWTLFTGAATSGVARAFPGGRLPHPEDQNEEGSKEKLRKMRKKYRKK